jgi:hypothetical protein
LPKGSPSESWTERGALRTAGSAVPVAHHAPMDTAARCSCIGEACGRGRAMRPSALHSAPPPRSLPNVRWVFLGRPAQRLERLRSAGRAHRALNSPKRRCVCHRGGPFRGPARFPIPRRARRRQQPEAALDLGQAGACSVSGVSVGRRRRFEVNRRASSPPRSARGGGPTFAWITLLVTSSLTGSTASDAVAAGMRSRELCTHRPVGPDGCIVTARGPQGDRALPIREFRRRRSRSAITRRRQGRSLAAASLRPAGSCISACAPPRRRVFPKRGETALVPSSRGQLALSGGVPGCAARTAQSGPERAGGAQSVRPAQNQVPRRRWITYSQRSRTRATRRPGWSGSIVRAAGSRARVLDCRVRPPRQARARIPRLRDRDRCGSDS